MSPDSTAGIPSAVAALSGIGWPAALVIVAFIAALAWVLVTFIRSLP